MFNAVFSKSFAARVIVWGLAAGLFLVPFSTHSAERSLLSPTLSVAGAYEPKALLVLELFSSEICMFCPAAEALLAEKVAGGNVIGLTCMVDYMQTRSDGPGRPFCTARQAEYALKLGTGPNYTPQMIVNGTQDAIGHKIESVDEAMRRASERPILALALARSAAQPERFSVALPDLGPSRPAQPLSLVVALYRRQIGVQGTAGAARALTHLVFDLRILESWDGTAQSLSFSAAIEKGDGLALLVQDPVTGALVAAGALETPEP